jgi:glycosyltransferase involved in cell wall biosynthesis
VAISLPVGRPFGDEPFDFGATAELTVPGAEGAISVVVPLRDEEPTLVALYEQLAQALDPLGRAWEVIFVDDGSTDGSYRTLRKLVAETSNVRALQLRRNFGKATALALGFEAARGEVVVTIDADLQDDPGEIPALVEKLGDGYDLVTGWKADRHDPLSRRAVSKVFNVTTRLITGVRLHDMNCGLKVYRVDVVRNLPVYGELHRFLPALAHHRGYRVAELPVKHRPREHGRSRYGFERYLRGLFDLFTVAFMGRYRSRPLHLFGGLGLGLAAVGFAILSYLTVIKLGGAGIGRRPLLMLGVLLEVVGVQFFSLGLIGEMLASHHEERTPRGQRERTYVREILE